MATMIEQPAMAAPSDRPPGDERLARVSTLRRLLQRPELGALLGAIVVFALFAAVDESGGNQFSKLGGAANWTDGASTTGIVAVAVAMLMIGGEFDLSSGVMVGSSGLLLGLLTRDVGFDMWPAIVLVFVFAAAVGFLNGMLVVRTKLPSFIVTLATMFALMGMNLGFVKTVTGTVRIDRLDRVRGFDSAHAIFASELWDPHNFKVTVVWWIVITALATWVLTRTRTGNWIFSVGGDANAARNVGVPVARTKVGLFVFTSMSAALVGIMIALRLRSMQGGQGIGQELVYIVAAVVGGCLLTGGLGSAIGAAIGALIIGMAFIGISFAGWNSDYQRLFLGVILFVAVLVNANVRQRAAGARH